MLLHRQPFKALYLAYHAVTTAFITLPAWTIIYAPPFFRPRPTWSLWRTVCVKLLRRAGRIASRMGAGGPSADCNALVADAKGNWVEPVPENFIVGGICSMAVAAGLHPVRLPGYWLDRDGSDIPAGTPAASGEKVIYHLHGGGYVAHSANPSDPTANIGRGLMKHCAAVRRVFSIEYRLSSVTDGRYCNPFPAALIDALTGYHYLVNTLGFRAEDVILEGDSAGGHLALALVRYLLENKNDTHVATLSLPSRLILLSPWVDLSTLHETQDSSFFQCSNTDYIDHGDVHEKVEIFAGPFGSAAAEINPYLSPASPHPSLTISFKGYPKTFITAGGAEILRDQIRTLRDRMVKDLGNGVLYYEPPDAVHDYTVFRFHEPERTETFSRIGEWLLA